MVMEIDFKPKYNPNVSRRLNSIDYMSGTSHSPSGVVKTFESISNLASFNKSIVHRVDALYKKVTPSTMRGSRRHGILAACLYKILIDDGKFFPEKYIIDLFAIEKKSFTKGLKMLSQVTKVPVPLPQDIIRTFAMEIGIRNEDHLRDISEFARQMCCSHTEFNRSCASSVAGALLFFFIRARKDIRKSLPSSFDIKSFTKHLKISEVTINNLCSRAESVIAEAFA